MRRSDKTPVVWRELACWLADGIPRERLMQVSFEDNRPDGILLQDLDGQLESCSRLRTDWRDQRR